MERLPRRKTHMEKLAVKRVYFTTKKSDFDHTTIRIG